MVKLTKGKSMYYIFPVIAVIIFIFIFSWWFERNSVYFPYRPIEATPETIGLNYEDIYYMTQDRVKINGWFIHSKGPARATVIFCHGNAGNISHRLEIIKVLNALDLNIFIFDYRGYGRSSGRPSEKGTYLDALGAYEYITGREDVDKEKIIIHGKSLGGAIAVNLVDNINNGFLIVESAFTSVPDIGKEIYPFLPIHLVGTIKYDSIEKIKRIDVPKLIIHSKQDEIVPFHHGISLFNNASDPKEFYEMLGGHNEAMLIYEEEYRSRIDEFLKNNGI